MLLLLNGVISTLITWNCSHEMHLLFSLEIFIHFFISVWNLFFFLYFGWKFNTTFCISLFRKTLPLGSSFSWFLWLFDIAPLMLDLNPFHFLALQHTLPSSCIFIAPVLESSISSESWFLLLWNDIRNQNLGSMCVSCLGTLIAFRPSQLTKEKIHVYVLPPVWYVIFINSHVYPYWLNMSSYEL